MDFTEEELDQLMHLVRRLDRNRHFIGDGKTVGIACLNFRTALDANEKVIRNRIEREKQISKTA